MWLEGYDDHKDSSELFLGYFLVGHSHLKQPCSHNLTVRIFVVQSRSASQIPSVLLLTATGRCADIGRGAALKAAGRRFDAGGARADAAAAGGQVAGQGEQGLEQFGHVGVLLGRALDHLGPVKKKKMQEE